VSADVGVIFNHLPKIAGQIDARVVDIINRGILLAEAAAVPLVPVLTGALRNNRTTDYATPGNHTATLTFNMEYSIFVHEGTSRMPARPFARMGLDAAAPGIEADLSRLVEG